jgi:hypothetical protein
MADTAHPGERRIKSRLSRSSRLLFAGIGAALVVTAVVVRVASESPKAWVGMGALLLLGIGGLLSGLLSGDAYVGPNGLRRSRLLGSRLFAWRDITCIELDEDNSGGQRHGQMRIYAGGRRILTLTMGANDLDRQGRRLLRRAKWAFTDDRRSGEVSPPRQGDPERIRLRAEEVATRAQRHHRGMAMFWLVPSLVPLGLGLVGVVLLLGREPIGIVPLVVGVAGCALAVRLVRRLLARARRVRESLSEYLD